MRRPSYTKQFDRDLKRMLKRGNDSARIKLVITKLINEELLAPKHKDHKLVGKFIGRRECHVEPDWLLIYKIAGNEICKYFPALHFSVMTFLKINDIG